MSEAWPPTKLGECCDILDSLRIPLNAEQRGDIQGDVPYYGANGLQGYIDKFIFDEPLILLAEDGGYFDEYESRPIAYKINGKSWVNNHAHILRAKSGGPFSQDFIFYCLQHKNITPFIKGGTRAKLNQAELREILIPRAPQFTQRRIAEILSTLDEAIEHTEALIAKHQQIKAGLMHDLFTRGVTPDGHLRPTHTQSPDLYKQSPLGWIPKEWEIAPLVSFATSRPGGFVNGPFGSDLLTSELTDSGVVVIYVQDIRVDGYRRVSNAHVTEEKANELLVCNVRFGDVLVAKVGDPPGVAATYAEAQRAVVTQDVIRIRPADDVVSQFLAGLLNATVGSRAIRRITIEGTRARVSLTEFKSLLLPKPTREEQQLIADHISVAQQLLSTFTIESGKLKTQKHGLMHDLLTGRVRVPERFHQEHAKATG